MCGIWAYLIRDSKYDVSNNLKIMFEKFNDNPTQIRKEEVIDNTSLCNYLFNFLDIDKSNFELLQFPSGFSNLTYLIISNPALVAVFFK